VLAAIILGAILGEREGLGGYLHESERHGGHLRQGHAVRSERAIAWSRSSRNAEVRCRRALRRPEFATMLEEQLIGNGRKPAVPTFVYHSATDDVIPCRARLMNDGPRRPRAGTTGKDLLMAELEAFAARAWAALAWMGRAALGTRLGRAA
jgi:hypothetical protein